MEHLCYNRHMNMLIQKAYRYRLYPNNTQQNQLAVNFGHARFVYNFFLAQRIQFYEENRCSDTKKGLNYYDNANKLSAMKRSAELEWLKDAHSQVLQQSLKDLDTAYQNFFKKRAKFPRFHSKHGKQAIRYPQGVQISEKHIRVPKIGWVKAVIHRPCEGKIKNVTVSKTKSGRYFASVQVEIDVPEPQEFKPDCVGVDVGLKSFLVTSDGMEVPAPKHLEKSQKRLTRLQRKLSRTKKGSSGREKARLAVARQHERVADQRKDFLHKSSRWLVDNYGFIGIEDLLVRGMVRNHCLARAISDAGWGEFRRQLEYKGTWYGTQVVAIDRFCPSSKTCSDCGYIVPELNLSIREWVCPECGAYHDRDLNAAVNIKNEALSRAGIARIHAGGESVRPTLSWQFSQKPEAQCLHCPADAGQHG
jgi:putative transposase